MLPKNHDWWRRTNERHPIQRVSIAATRVAGLLALWAAFAPPSVAEDITEASLGGYPLCEASAAPAVECPNSNGGRCLLVGDNEVTDRLFLFTFDEDAPDRLAERREVPMLSKDGKSEALSDIEAMVGLGSGELLIYGSHSRNKACDRKKKRRQTFRGQLGETSFVVTDSTALDEPKCKELFDVSRENARGNMKLLCDRIRHTEDEADVIDDTFDKGDKTDEERTAAETACNKTEDFNLEGAVAIKDGDQEAIWVGLRAPLVDSHAVLMRQKSKKKFEFDAVVLLDLGGAGIRELAAAGDSVWVIAGPPNDSDAKHTLQRFPLSALAADSVVSGNARIRAENSTLELPTSAEGLVILGDMATVMVDGDEPESNSVLSCRKDSTYKVFSLSGF